MDPLYRENDRRPRTLLWAVGTLVALVALGALVGDRGDGPEADREVSPADSYLDEYGGERSVYDRILATSDCRQLQSDFDIAADNNTRAEPGSSQHRLTLGYMTAADDRLEAAGCY